VSASRESLLVLSDLHLGSDVNDRAPPGGACRRSQRIDADLIALLAHYRATRPIGDRWRLVIAGDLIDFMGMAVESRGCALDTELTNEERAHGLGTAADHARVKLRRVAERHADVFAALAAFVRAGHALTVVHGNHDVEFYWEDVRSDFRALLVAHARAQDPALDADVFEARVEFTPWFFYRRGVAYIEHGHQYDPLCATEHVMAPLSPRDPRRLAPGFCEVLLRYVVRPTRGLREHGHERLGMLDYLVFAARLGLGGMVALGGRFALAIIELFRVRRAQLSQAAQALREEHERRMAQLAESSRLGLDRLQGACI
jgi:3',5'-cyclic AMP phosphodiesterase CpdA